MKLIDGRRGKMEQAGRLFNSEGARDTRAGRPRHYGGKEFAAIEVVVEEMSAPMMGREASRKRIVLRNELPS